MYFRFIILEYNFRFGFLEYLSALDFLQQFHRKTISWNFKN